MKFRLSTLLLLLLVASVLFACTIYIVRERRASLQRLSEAKAIRETTLASSLEMILENQSLKRRLGILDVHDTNQPFVQMVPLPGELGGHQSFGLPLIWRWKFYLPRVEDLEVCFAVADIPESGFEIDESSIFRSRVNHHDNSLSAGSLSFGGAAWDNDQPVEVLLHVRLDQRNEKGVFYVNYQVYQDVNQSLVQPSNPGFRGTGFVFPGGAESWLNDISLSQCLRGNQLNGLSVQTCNVPDWQNTFTFDQPIELLRMRARRKIGEHQYEDVDGNSDGLLIWVRKFIPVADDGDF